MIGKNGIPTVGIVIPTLNAEKLLSNCLRPLLSSPLKPRILVIDSSSSDNTLSIAQSLGVETLCIERKDFNHGLTREFGRKYLGTDIVVMITPDANAIDNEVLGILIKPIIEGIASVSYARQLPHDGAGFFESFPRIFNYPEKSNIRSIKDLDHYGVYTYFCSDSFAAYSSKALDEVGGFKKVLLGEDTLAVAQLLHINHKVAYVAEAQVKHSHGYSLQQEFHRYFDTGLARAEYQDWIKSGNKNESNRGGTYIKEMVKVLWKKQPYLLPYAFIQTACKWLGYKLGYSCRNAPIWLKKRLSAYPTYWNTST